MDEIDRDIQRANTFRLAMIGKGLNDLVVAVGEAYHASPLTQSLITEFREYEQRIEHIGHITDPTGYRDLLYSGGFEEAARRRKLIAALIEYYGYPAEDEG